MWQHTTLRELRCHLSASTHAVVITTGKCSRCALPICTALICHCLACGGTTCCRPHRGLYRLHGSALNCPACEGQPLLCRLDWELTSRYIIEMELPDGMQWCAWLALLHTSATRSMQRRRTELFSCRSVKASSKCCWCAKWKARKLDCVPAGHRRQWNRSGLRKAATRTHGSSTSMAAACPTWAIQVAACG